MHLYAICVYVQSEFQNLRPSINARWWETDVYKAKYFNDFVFYGLRQNILNKVIVNGMSGSSWRFCRFVMLNVKILNLDREIKIKRQSLLTLRC